MQVRVTAMSADLSSTELGLVDADTAVALFESHPWPAELARADALDASQVNVCDPDMTFTALPAHLVVSAATLDTFNIEVCLPRLDRLLGIFARSRFFHFKAVPRQAVPALIRGFCTDALEQRHSFFAQLETHAANGKG